MCHGISQSTPFSQLLPTVSMSPIFLLKDGGNTMFRWYYLHDQRMKTKGIVDKILFFFISCSKVNTEEHW